jgi:hypothetical protein
MYIPCADERSQSYGDFQATAIRRKTARLDAPGPMFQLAGEKLAGYE